MFAVFITLQNRNKHGAVIFTDWTYTEALLFPTTVVAKVWTNIDSKSVPSKTTDIGLDIHRLTAAYTNFTISIFLLLEVKIVLCQFKLLILSNKTS